MDDIMTSAPAVEIDTNGRGTPIKSIDNFLRVLKHDPWFDGMRFNDLAYRPETASDGDPRPWSDFDDANAMNYIEKNYQGLYNKEKYSMAFRALMWERRMHPIRDILKNVEWDGVARIEGFLHTWMKADDNAYSRECSRLIFSGGIHRLYHPGCKFDDMIVLIGTKQGEGKSTLVRWLAIEDKYYADVKQFDGKEGIEELQGAWICEAGELLAMKRAKEVEAIKAFLTRQVDRCRHPFDVRTTDHPRGCIFIGTTNSEQFLSDKTGNRRFYPIKVHQSGYALFDMEAECRAYILQCWAEAKAKLNDDFMRPYADRDILGVIRREQELAAEDDWREGAIEKYLSDKSVGERVCNVELRSEALHRDVDMMRTDRSEEADIRAIMQKFSSEWVLESGKTRLHGLPDKGPQRCWRKIAVGEDDPF